MSADEAMYEVPGSRLRELTDEIRTNRKIIAALLHRLEERSISDGAYRVVLTEAEVADVDLSRLRIKVDPLHGTILLRYGSGPD